MNEKRADGTGQAKIREKTPQESVSGETATNVPGGESKSGSHIKIQGPNSYGKK